MKENKDRPITCLLCLLFFLSGCGLNPWKVAETPHLSIYYKSGSYAEKHLEQAKIEYENSFQLATQLVPRIKTAPKVKVYLYDELKSKGFAYVTKYEVHYLYGEAFRLTSLHEFLHVFLYEINPKAPLRLDEGICRVWEERRKQFNGTDHQVPLYQLAKLAPQDLWTVHEVFQNKYKNDVEGNVAAAFVFYAMQELGEQSFWAFYREFNQHNWQAVVVKYFGKSLEMIDQEFKSFVQNIPDPPEAFR